MVPRATTGTGTKRRREIPNSMKRSDSSSTQTWTSQGPICSSAECEPQILILGTAPSPQSDGYNLSAVDKMKRGGSGPQNYGNPQNSFWDIMGSCLNFRRDCTEYTQQKAVLNSQGIIVWDVIHKAVSRSTQRSALDKDIDFTKSEANDIPGLLLDYPTLVRLVFPQNSANVFLKFFWKKGKWLVQPKQTEQTAGSTAVPGSKIVFYVDPENSQSEQTENIFRKTSKLKQAVPLKPLRSLMPALRGGTNAGAKATGVGVGGPASGEAAVRYIELVVCPSTSPANASTRPAEKEKRWHQGCFGHHKPVKTYRCPACITQGDTTRQVETHWLVDCPHLAHWSSPDWNKGETQSNEGHWYYHNRGSGRKRRAKTEKDCVPRRASRK